MEERDSGIVLRVRPLTESSLIILWLTQSGGRISTVAKGARRPKSSFQGKLDLYYEVDITYVRSRRSTLHTQREVALKNPHSALRHELIWLHQAAYAARLIEHHTEEETPIPTLFDLFTDFIRQLPSQPPSARSILAFELKALKILGWPPDSDQSKLARVDQDLLLSLAQLPTEHLHSILATPASYQNVARYIGRFITYHLEHLPKGRPAALGFDP